MHFRMIKNNRKLKDRIKEGKKEGLIELKKLQLVKKINKRIKKKNKYLVIKYLRRILIGNNMYKLNRNRKILLYQIKYYLMIFCNYKMI